MAATAHILTVNVEEYFQALPLSRVLRPRQWTVLPSRVDRNIDELLAFFDQRGVRATFFVPRWHAERQPEIIARILATGHEIAARGRLLEEAEQQSFSEDLALLEALLQGAGAGEIMGYRSGMPIRVLEEWQQAALLSRGYRYDASLECEAPSSRMARSPGPTTVDAVTALAVRSCRFFSRGRILSDCSSLRSLPGAKRKEAVAALTAAGDGMLFSMQSWELDSDQPRITALSRKEATRQYGRLAESREILESVFATGNFASIQATFGFEPDREQRETPLAEETPLDEELCADPVELSTTHGVTTERMPVSMIVPLYNEQEGLDYLGNSMSLLTSALEKEYSMQYILVDDGSNDDTWQGLQHRYAARDNCRLVRHEANLGVSAAILTGIRAATSEIVCSMDADGSYDPLVLAKMLPLIEEADLVTASP